jgi:hypothetical protein
MNIGALPVDILGLVLSNLSYVDYWKVNCLCKSIYKNLKYTQYKLDLNYYTDDFIQSYWMSLAQNQLYSRFLFTNKVYFISDKYLHPINCPDIIKLPYFADSVKHITELYFIQDYIDLTRKDKHIHNKIKQIQLKHKTYNVDTNTSTFYNKCDTTMQDTDTGIKHIISVIPDLKSLGIHIDLCINPVDCLFNYLPNTITSLDLSGIINFNDTHINIISHKCPLLKKLQLKYADITDNGLKYLTLCSSLENCYLYGCTHITDVGLEYISTIGSIRKITLDWCNLITDSGINTLVKSNPNLTHISLQCTTIGEPSVNSMLKYLNYPSYINMNYCYRINILNLSRLRKKCKLVLNNKIN